MKRFLLSFVIVVAALTVSRMASAATLSVTPNSASLRVGETKTFSIVVSSTDQTLNAGQGRLSYPADKLQLLGISKSGLFTYWILEPSGSNGDISFGGGLPSPGYKGGGRAILTVSFRAKATGTAAIRFNSGSVLANDGKGTDITSGTSGATVTVLAAAVTNTAPSPAPSAPSTPTPTINSSTHPNQGKWYAKTDVQFTWTRLAGMQGVSYVFDQVTNTTPDDTTESGDGAANFRQTADGVWYLHLKAKYASGWSATVHYRVYVDTQSPENFTPNVEQDGDARNPKATLTFRSSDAGSGIDHYELSLNSEPFKTVTSPVTTEQKRAGLHQFTVRAFDLAGNLREAVGEFTVEGSPAPRLTKIPSSVALFSQITIEGLSVQGDTVVLTIDGREVGRFSAAESRIVPNSGVAIPDGLVLWRFQSTPFLAPGFHELSAKAVNQYGIESPATVPVSFQTLGQTFGLFGWLIPTYALIAGLVIIIFILLAALLVVWERYQHWRRAESFDLNRAEDEINEEIEKLQASLEKDIVGAIRTAVTERSMQAATHEQIRQDIAQTRQRIDSLIEKQVKQLKKKRQRK